MKKMKRNENNFFLKKVKISTITYIPFYYSTIHEKRTTMDIAIDVKTLIKQNHTLDLLIHAIHAIARNACLFKVSEIIVVGNMEEPDTILVGSLFQYFVTPRYLSKEAFAVNVEKGLIDKKVFKKAGKMPLIASIVGMLKPESSRGVRFREGISVFKKQKNGGGEGGLREKTASGKVKKNRNKGKKTMVKNGTRFVNVGLEKMVELEEEVPAGVRVSVDVDKKKVVGVEEAWGGYCGYAVRVAADVEGVFTGGKEYEGGVFVRVGGVFARSAGAGAADDVVGGGVGAKVGGQAVVVFVADDAGEGEQFFDAVMALRGARAEDGAVVAMGRGVW